MKLFRQTARHKHRYDVFGRVSKVVEIHWRRNLRV